MSLLPIYLFGTLALRKKAKPVNEINNGVVKLVLDMFETMHKANGIGLAATQVGSTQRVVVIDIADVEEKEGTEEPPNPHKKTSPDLPLTLTLINPELSDPQGSGKMEEGCLSIPEVRDQVERAETIRVEFRDLNDKAQEFVADGLLARVILHEVDHLNGVLFLDHLSPAKRKLLKGKLSRIRRGEVETSYPVISKQEE
jgi:peptide deformylase